MSDIPLSFEIPSDIKAKKLFRDSAVNTKASIRELLMMPAPLSPEKFERLADFVEKFHGPGAVSARRASGVDDSFSYNFTLATFAISNNHINAEVLELLHRAGVDLRAADGYGKTPYERLMEKGCFDEAATLEKLLAQKPGVAVKTAQEQADHASVLYVIDVAG